MKFQKFCIYDIYCYYLPEDTRLSEAALIWTLVIRHVFRVRQTPSLCWPVVYTLYTTFNNRDWSAFVDQNKPPFFFTRFLIRHVRICSCAQASCGGYAPQKTWAHFYQNCIFYETYRAWIIPAVDMTVISEPCSQQVEYIGVTETQYQDRPDGQTL